MSPSGVQAGNSQIKRRRAIGYVVMSALLPGSVQLFAGSRRIGRAALYTWFALWAVVVLLVLGLLVWRGPTIALLLNPVFLFIVRGVVWLVALGWIGLLVDAWRRAVTTTETRPSRLILTLISGVLVVAMAGAGVVVANALSAMGDIGSIFGGSGQSNAQAGRYNIVLLGADSGPTREGMRPDSIMVASIQADTGKTVLFSLPRNLEGAPFPASNPLHKLYPKGYSCPQSKCMLNGIYTLANEHASLFPRGADPGLTSMTDVVGELTGLTINYYALIDLAGFQSLIDAVGGVRLDIGHRIPIGGVSTKISGYIEPGKNQLLDGYHALWFARSRAESDDYDRMQRQKCVLNAMVKQLDPLTVAGKFNELAAAGKGIVQTSVPTSDISKLIDLAMIVKGQKIASVSFAPPLINPGRPDFDVIRREVASAIAKSEGNEPSAAPVAPTSAVPSSSPTKKRTTTQPAPAPTVQRETEDLGSVCSVPG